MTFGRKYQHIEDLVLSHGSHGALHAIERLASVQRFESVELKMDGAPVLYWGRNTKDEFFLITKNAWEQYQRGTLLTLPSTPAELESYILSTGVSSADRIAYASSISALWSQFESISPCCGYVEGCVLFYPGLPPLENISTNEYSFTPNITTFFVNCSSTLGKQISTSSLMVAITGYYLDPHSPETRNTETISSTNDTIVIDTLYVPHCTKTVFEPLRLEVVNCELIDRFLIPKNGLSKPGNILYKFYNQNLRSVGIHTKFNKWAELNLSRGQQLKILEDKEGLDSVFSIIDQIIAAKLHTIQVLNRVETGDFVKQVNAEGYVQSHPGIKFVNNIPGQFIKLIDQQVWAPRKNK